MDATAAAAPGASSLFLGRQPILDRDGRLFAFELLFRSGTRNAASFDDGVAATAAVITNTFNELGIEAVLGKSRGFINLTEAFLMSDLVELMPRDKVVLEVLETVRPTPQVAARCAELHRMGFSLALDDVVSADPAFEPLLPAVEFIKVDVLQTSREARRAIVHNDQPRGIKLVAEKSRQPRAGRRVSRARLRLLPGLLLRQAADHLRPQAGALRGDAAQPRRPDRLTASAAPGCAASRAGRRRTPASAPARPSAATARARSSRPGW